MSKEKVALKLESSLIGPSTHSSSQWGKLISIFFVTEAIFKAFFYISGRGSVSLFAGGPDSSCTYKCKDNGGCTVEFESDNFFSGASKGSCFPASFGGACLGTPNQCEDCNKVMGCK